MIEFLLNNEPVQISAGHANVTVLEYLRLERQLCGSKEGCGTGDCGACTVVVGVVDEVAGVRRLTYQNINSCITFLAALHGRQLLTVEHLAAGERLHPVQQAMVDHHGAQCGFCTPGFIMSMFALYHAAPAASPLPHTMQYLAGNLCRCTGYQPIIQAALSTVAEAPHDAFTANQDATAAKLAAMHTAHAAHQQCGTALAALPRSLPAVFAAMAAQPTARLLAGGTDLAVELTTDRPTVPLIALAQVAELRTLTTTEAGDVIGAGVTLVELAVQLGARYPQLARLLTRFGSRQIRHQATIGGNLATASPIGDLPPVFLALDAQITLQNAAATRTLPLTDFFIDYRKTALARGELIRSVTLPPDDAPLFIYKVSKRFDDDISSVCFAAQVRVENARIITAHIAYGGMAALPKRATACERALCGQLLTAATIARAAARITDDFQPIDDVRASADYRLQVARNLLTRLLWQLTEPMQAVAIEHEDIDHADHANE